MRGVSTAAKAAPFTTAGVGGAAAASIPSSTGKTPWEVMQENWESRRKDLRGQMSAEDAILSAEAQKLKMSPADQSRLEKLKNELLPLRQRFESFKAKGQADYPDAQTALGKATALEKAISDIENRGGQIDLQRKQSEDITGPATARRKTAEGKLTAIE